MEEVVVVVVAVVVVPLAERAREDKDRTRRVGKHLDRSTCD